MPGPDEKAVVQHEWVSNEWEESDGSISAEYYCQNCYRSFDHDAPDEEIYSACPEYEGDDDGEATQADDSD